jgi:type I restriction enzyme M protein
MRGRRTRRPGSRARSSIRQQAGRRGWDVRHLARGGEVLEETEIAAHVPDLGLGLDEPDFLFCLAGAPAIVVEVKDEAGKLDQALSDAQGYADQINDAGRYRVRVAVGAAGEEDAGFVVAVRFLTRSGWIPLTAGGHELTALPTRREAELALAADDGTTTVTVPAGHEFIDAAIELSQVLRAAKVEAPLRPKVIGAIAMAMYEGTVDTSQDRALASVNELAERGVRSSVGLPDATKDLLVDALRVTTADFDRLAPSIGRVVAILRRLNVRSVLQTDTDFLGMFYEAFLRYGYDNNALGIVFTPRHITRFCVDLLGARATDRVIDVASGTGGFLVAAFDAMKAQAQGEESVGTAKESIYGAETNPTVWALSVLNMFFRGDGKSHMRLGSCFAPDHRRDVSRRFTRAYLNPPFSQQDEPEVDFIDAALDALEPGGLLAAIVYAGVFADEPHVGWREQFLRKHTLLGVISLPEDLFYPTAAPTSIVLARAHVPQRDDAAVFMARVWNDGYEKLKTRRVERPGSQLPEIAEAFHDFLAGGAAVSRLSTTIEGSALRDGAEWSPQQWLPQPRPTNAEVHEYQEFAIRSIYRAVAQYPELADSALEDFTSPWAGLPELPIDESGALSRFFDVRGGKSTGERNYADGESPYVSSGDATNSIIRLVSYVHAEGFDDGGLTVTAFGTACVQPWPFMGRGNGGSAVRVLIPRFDMTVRELMWFAAQINLQRWRFLYARMAIKSRIERLEVCSPPRRLRDGGEPLASALRAFRDTFDRLSALSVA